MDGMMPSMWFGMYGWIVIAILLVAVVVLLLRRGSGP